MLDRLIEWSLRNQLVVIVGLLLAVLGGVWSITNTTVDAIPDLSDVQVIIFTEFPGQAPQVVEDQVTYPITSTMLAVPFATRLYTHSVLPSLARTPITPRPTSCTYCLTPAPWLMIGDE